MAHLNKKNKTWQADIQVNGKRYRRKGFLSKEIAQAWELQQKIRTQRGKVGLEVTETISIGEIVKSYLKHAKQYKKPKASKREQSSLTHWLTFLGARKEICDIEEKTVRDFVSWRKASISTRGKEISNRTINIDLECFYRCLEWSVDSQIISKNPIRPPKKFKLAKPGLPRYFSLDEIALISEEAKKDSRKTMMYEAFEILIRTGIRTGELCSLNCSDVDFSRKALIVRPETAKAGRMRIVPLEEKAISIFRELVEKANIDGRNFLFCTDRCTRQTPDNLTRRFNCLLKKLGISGNLHTCRKTFISWRIMAGCDPVKVMAWVGHEDWTTMKRYLALSQKYLETSETFQY